MLIVDRNCANSLGGHKVDFSAFNCRFTVQKGGLIDLEKSERIDKKKSMGDLNGVAAELLSRSQYEQVSVKELKSDPPKKAEAKKAEAKKDDTAKTDKDKDAKKSGK